MYSFIVSTWFIVLTIIVLLNDDITWFEAEGVEEDEVTVFKANDRPLKEVKDVYSPRCCTSYSKSAQEIQRELRGWYASWKENNQLVNDNYRRRMST